MEQVLPENKRDSAWYCIEAGEIFLYITVKIMKLNRVCHSQEFGDLYRSEELIVLSVVQKKLFFFAPFQHCDCDH